jgi:hypothetical protein
MKKECTLIILNLLTGERITDKRNRQPLTPSELLAVTLPRVMPKAPKGFAALLECAGEPRYADTQTVATPQRTQDGHFKIQARCEIVVTFPGCHYAAIQVVSQKNTGKTFINEQTTRNAYTPERNLLAVRAFSSGVELQDDTLKEHAERYRLAYVADIAEEFSTF